MCYNTYMTQATTDTVEIPAALTIPPGVEKALKKWGWAARTVSPVMVDRHQYTIRHFTIWLQREFDSWEDTPPYVSEISLDVMLYYDINEKSKSRMWCELLRIVRPI